MKWDEMTFAELLALYNSISKKQAGPKTFASRSRLIERITKTAEAEGISIGTLRQPEKANAVEVDTKPSAYAIEAPINPTEKSKSRRNGVGEFACRLLMDLAGLPYKAIAEIVNDEIPGAAATDKSVRWYASKMRKNGVEVPARETIRKNHIWITAPETAKQ